MVEVGHLMLSGLLPKKKIEELQTAVDNRRHAQVTSEGDVVSNFALAISPCDLYKQCSESAKEKELTDDSIPSLL